MSRRRTAYWWNARPNYGDLLTPLLLARFADLEVTWAPIDQAQIIVVGSILDQLPPGWEGTVVGAGKLKEDSQVDLSDAHVLALRGALSAAGVKGDYVLGDPGLLCAEIMRIPEKRYDLTVVPHWSDRHLAERFAHLDPHVVDPAADCLTVIAEIAASKKIVSSSLHGVIIADSYRIPRRLERFPNIDHPWEGGAFKYFDYASALGELPHFGTLHTPNPRAVDRAQAELFDVFRSLSHHGDHHRDRD